MDTILLPIFLELFFKFVFLVQVLVYFGVSLYIGKQCRITSSMYWLVVDLQGNQNSF